MADAWPAASFVFDSASEADTDRLGAALAGVLPSGTVVGLIGTLGAGKTRLVQAIAAAQGVPRDAATSPTFVLVNEYRGRLPIYHIDAYRLRDEDEFQELGPEEYFESDGVTLVEWADRVADCLPAERLEIHCEATGESQRRFRLSAVGAAAAQIIKEVRRALVAE
ncbi:MAG: tRNA (adenosine(37)-N6)-threonylcarbamoyltransferase complex ATPase subunit type 1 TsaE [Pirellulales bacterium]|nr:tRNA (adenosine(37)-N6)-threonylcarbamoyltransferase complex ATPase subunit type 1 TsaE [Pirellulales bacterium]